MSDGPTIDLKLFRQALGTFVTGVTVVTTRAADGRPVGLTANSFNSVSLDPPLVLWSLALNSPNLPAFREAGYWAVHILTIDQQDLSQRFASKGIDKFAGLDLEEGPGAVPLFEGCAARFACRATFEYEGGDHAIFVGEVIDLELEQAAPLLFHGGRYGEVMPQVQRSTRAPDADAGEFGRHFTGHLLGRAYNAAFADLRREYRRRGLRSADYTVVVSLGLGEGITPDELRQRTQRAGVQLPQVAIERLIAEAHVSDRDGLLHLTSSGKRLLTELIAVAETTQLRLDQQLTATEMGLLHQLLEKIGE